MFKLFILLLFFSFSISLPFISFRLHAFRSKLYYAEGIKLCILFAIGLSSIRPPGRSSAQKRWEEGAPPPYRTTVLTLKSGHFPFAYLLHLNISLISN